MLSLYKQPPFRYNKNIMKYSCYCEYKAIEEEQDKLQGIFSQKQIVLKNKCASFLFVGSWKNLVIGNRLMLKKQTKLPKTRIKNITMVWIKNKHRFYDTALYHNYGAYLVGMTGLGLGRTAPCGHSWL